jgi:hypothetical protein
MEKMKMVKMCENGENGGENGDATPLFRMERKGALTRIIVAMFADL